MEGIIADEARYGEIPADIQRMIGFDAVDRKITPKTSVTLWGTGTPYREFLYVNDMAAASIFVMNWIRPYTTPTRSPCLATSTLASAAT